MAVMFDLESIGKVLTEAPLHIYEGTCELCSFGGRKLSDVGGVLCCDQCRNTLAKWVKEHNHPFAEVAVAMDPRLSGDGAPGFKTVLAGESDQQRIARGVYARDALVRSLKRAYPRGVGR